MRVEPQCTQQSTEHCMLCACTRLPLLSSDRYALNGKEVTSILMQRLVKVDGKASDLQWRDHWLYLWAAGEGGSVELGTGWAREPLMGT